jgi:hypothetical protein
LCFVCSSSSMVFFILCSLWRWQHIWGETLTNYVFVVAHCLRFRDWCFLGA